MFFKTAKRHTACSFGNSRRGHLAEVKVIMRKTLLINLLIASLALPACSEKSVTIVTDHIGPDAPINDPDTRAFNPTSNSSDPDPTGLGNTAGGGQADPTNNPDDSDDSPKLIAGPTPGQEGQGNGSGGEPVPEPGTLLLVGSGLAGIGASILHRRRRPKAEPA